MQNNKKKVVVTGCAGFIGSNLVDSLLFKNFEVIGIDNLKTGKLNNLTSAFKNKRFSFYEIDLLKAKKLSDIFENCDMVYHLSANADIRFGPENPSRDLEQNTIVTHKVLETMRTNDIQKLMFASTGSLYGDSKIFPTPEDTNFPNQTSLYGASKLACESFISAYCETYEFQAWIFRFVSILGPRYSHGHIYDFVRQLLADPTKLIVLGDGYQKKSYLHVFDCIKGIEIGIEKSNDKLNIFNLGLDDVCEVRDSIKLITQLMNVSPTIEYGEESRGWIGDNPYILLNAEKIKSIGWNPKYTIQDGIKDTVKFLLDKDNK
jgi:UDP-glucose 4-epimerase